VELELKLERHKSVRTVTDLEQTLSDTEQNGKSNQIKIKFIRHNKQYNSSYKSYFTGLDRQATTSHLCLPIKTKPKRTIKTNWNVHTNA